MMYLTLLLTGLVPIGATIGLYFLDLKTKFGQLTKKKKQIIFGVIYGLIAIMATELSPVIGGAGANIRDAAPILAGLVFGGPAGIIAGIIGGVERIFTTFWRPTDTTRWACSLSTVLAGFYAAGLRKYMFEDKLPQSGFALAIAVVMEVVHLTIAFLFQINRPAEIISTIKQLAIPMILGNALTVFIPVLVLRLITTKRNVKKEQYRKMATQVQFWLLASIAFCYLLSTSIIFGIQTNNAYQEAEKTFVLNINDVVDDVKDSSETYLKSILTNIRYKYQTFPYLPEKQKECEDKFRAWLTTDLYEVTSIDLIKKDDIGTFVCSSDATFTYDYHMMDGDQSAEIHGKMNKLNPEPFIQEFQIRGDTKEYKLMKYAAADISPDYYIVVGLDGVQYYKFVNSKVYDITSYRHVKNRGYILIMDINGNVVSEEGERAGKKIGLKIDDLRDKNGEYTRKRATIYETDSFYMYASAETYSIAIVLPYDEVLSDRDSSFMLVSFMEIIVFAILYSIIYFLLKAKVVRKIEKINHSLANIIDGDLETKVDVTSSYEFASLSTDINHTVDTLKHYIDEAEKRIDTELAFAKTIQLSTLPSVFPAFPDKEEFDLYAMMQPAKEVGGDFYDFHIISGDTLAFLVADVSGKGIPAAMFMMESKAMIRNLSKALLPPDEVLSKANDALAQNNKVNMFVTCWFGLLNFKTGHVRFANAGHNRPLVFSSDGKWKFIEQKKNVVLGALEGSSYTLQEFDLKPGERLFLYTDGVTEATRGDDALYGEERLMAYLNKHIGDSLKDSIIGTKKDIDEFVEGADQFDDITMLTIEYKNAKK